MRIAYGSVAQPGQPFGYGVIGQMLKWALEQAGAEIVTGFGYDVIWWGILTVTVIEIGMLTPPVGLNVFVIRSVVGDMADTWTIFKGVAPFIVADMFVIGATMAWPDLVLFFVRLLE